MTKLHKLEWKSWGHGKGQAFLDSVKLEGVRAVTLRTTVGELTTATIELLVDKDSSWTPEVDDNGS